MKTELPQRSEVTLSKVSDGYENYFAEIFWQKRIIENTEKGSDCRFNEAKN